MTLRLDNLPRWLRDFAPPILWMGLIFFLSNQPTLIDIEQTLGDIGQKLIYKSAHALVYAVLVWLWWRALAPDRRLTWTALGLAFTLTVLYAVSDEIHQRFVPGRHGRVADVLFDASGALAMILLLRRVKWLPGFPESLTIQAANRSSDTTRQTIEVKES